MKNNNSENDNSKIEENYFLENKKLLKYYKSNECKNKIPKIMQNIVFFIINLNYSIKRLWNLLNELKNLNINIHLKRIEGYIGKNIIKDYKLKNIIDSKSFESSAKGIRPSHGDHSYGSIGCSISHLKCLKYFCEDNKFNDFEYLVILEDDSKLNVKSNEEFYKFFELNYRVTKIINNWDIISLNKIRFIDDPKKITQNDMNLNIIKELENNLSEKFYIEKIKSINLNFLNLFFGTGSFFYNKSSAQKIIEKFLPIRWQIDYFYSISELKIICYGSNLKEMYNKVPFCLRNVNSDINHTPVIIENNLMNDQVKNKINIQMRDYKNSRKKQEKKELLYYRENLEKNPIKKNQTNNENDENDTIIIVIVLVTIFSILFIIICFLFFMKRKKNNKNNKI